MTGSRAFGSELQWSNELGVGYLPPASIGPYDEAYFDHYAELAGTPMGRRLTEARVNFVARNYGDGPVVDIGIGAGQFCSARPRTKGYDVNPAGVEWLKDRALWHDFATTPCVAATFWDSLEHIPNPAAALAHVEQWVFVSLPVFYGRSHVTRSKHFKPDEHIWYWTRDGFRRWARTQGFVVREENATETLLGREDIRSFALERVSAVRPVVDSLFPGL